MLEILCGNTSCKHCRNMHNSGTSVMAVLVLSVYANDMRLGTKSAIAEHLTTKTAIAFRFLAKRITIFWTNPYLARRRCPNP